MKTSNRIRRALAWALIAALANPFALVGAQVPPNGVGDFTLYTAASASGGASEPNILLLIDTSDSMNLPEGWREYPGAYDSHVEYLWNDLNTIGIFEVLTERDGAISTGNGYGAMVLTGLMVMGNYSDPGYDHKVIIALHNASDYHVGGFISLAGMPMAGLNGTFPVVGVGPVSVTINLPPGVSFDAPATPASTFPISYAPGNQYATWQGNGNMIATIPGTVLPAPTKPLGFWGGASADARRQIWQAALNYAAATEPGDPGPRFMYRNYLATDQNAGAALYWLPAGTAETDARLWSNAFNRFLGADRMSRFGSVNGSRDPVMRGGINFGNLPALFSGSNQCQSSKDQLTPSTVFAPSSVAKNDGKYLGQKWQRYERYLSLDNSLAASYPGSSGNTIGWPHYDGYLNANRDADVFAVNTSAIALPILFQKPNNLANASYAGWTDLKPDWGGYHFSGRLLEIPDYQSFNQLLALYGLSTAGIATLNNARIAGYKGLAVPGYYDTGSSINIGAATLTKTRSCSWTGQNEEVDAGHLPVRGPATLSYGGTCRDLGISCSDGGRCAGVADPDSCSQSLADNFYTRDNNNCHWTGRSQLDTMTFSGCHWVGTRQPVPGEGVGNYYYGASCVGSCAGGNCPAPVDGGTNYCMNTTTVSQQFGANIYNNVLQTTDTNAGCGNRSDSGTVYYYGGSCAGDYRLPPGSAWNVTNDPGACDKTVSFASMTVNGVPMTDVRTDASTAGCSDKNDPWQDCEDQHGGDCQYRTCANRTGSASSGGTNYPVYNRVADTDNVMVHDCVADEGATGPFMTQLWRLFGAPWGSAAGNTAPEVNKALSYDTSPARRIGSAPAYDVYSVNYLNWKFGPKSNGNPIGRKTRLQTSKDAMVQLVQATDSVRFGLMVFNRMDMSHNSEGGNIVYAVQPMGTRNQVAIDAMSAADRAANATVLNNRQALISKINGLVAVSQTPLTESLYEAYRYFRGEAPQFGRLAAATTDGSQAAAGCDKSAFATPGNGVDCLGSSGNYVSPMMNSLDPNTGNPAACSKDFVVMMTDGGPEGDYSANAQIKALSYTNPVGGATVSPTQASTSEQFEASPGVPYGPVDAASTSYDGGYVWLDELAYYMANADMNDAIAGRQPVNTYTIGFAGADSPVLDNTAAKGNGLYYVAADAGALSTALTATIAAIREWNPTLAAPTIPVSALNRSESAAEVYLAYFGPSSSQAWNGTLKKFRLGQGSADCGTTDGTADGSPIALCLIGKTVLSGATVKNIEQATTDPLTGEQTVIVNHAAVSFWNPGNIQDSSQPNKGGTGQALLDSAAINPSTRKVYTFITDPGAANEAVSGSTDLSAGSNAVSEGSTLVTKARLGDAAMSDAQRASLINFIRGGDTATSACNDAPSAGTPCATWRGWPHADVMHSKAAIVTYDPTPTPDLESGANIASSQYLFYLSNDGLLHAINAANGQEGWSFLVEEALAQIQAMNANLAGQHLMLADGELSTWVYDANGDGKIVAADGDKVYLYFGLRRGGRAYYALDITDAGSPKFMWKIDRRPAGGELCNPTCSSVSVYDELGYSWSAPVAGRIRALPAAGVPALIFGGGYDGNQDNFAATDADSMGRAVYVVNGLTGSPLKVFKNGQSGSIAGGSISGMDFSIPSTVAALNTDLDSQGLIDRIYVGDMAANVWRFDIDSGNIANWTAKQLAALSDPFALPGTPPDRKIMIPPVVVKQAGYDAVYVGTGDREHPLVTTSADKMFMVKDSDVGLSASPGSLISFPDSLYDISNVFSVTQFAAATFQTKSGWYQSLQPGEKIFSQPAVFYNVLRYSTFNPTASVSACLPPGGGMLYAVDARYGSSMASGTADGRPPTTKQAPGIPVGGTRGVYSDPSVVIKDGVIYQSFCHDGTCSFAKIGTVGGATKMYWYRESAH